MSRILLALICTPALLLAQAPDTVWTKTFGGTGVDQCFDCLQTSDGGFIMVGYTESGGAGNEDVWLIKTDSFGNVEWDETYGSAEEDDRGYSFCETFDGGYIIAGYTTNKLGYNDILVIKTDITGNMEWEEVFGGFYAVEECYSIIQTSDSSYVMCGGNEDIWLLKIDQSGVLLWENSFGLDLSDYGDCVIERSDGGLALIGCSWDSIGYLNMTLILTDSIGNHEYSRYYWNPNSQRGGELLQTSDGGFIIIGETSATSNGHYDVWLVRTDDQCNMIWESKFGGYDDDHGTSLDITPSGEYLISGYSEYVSTYHYDLWAILADTSGTMIWDMAFGESGDEEGHAIELTADGGLIIGGSTSSYGAGLDDYWLIRTEPLVAIESSPSIFSDNLVLLSTGPNPFDPFTSTFRICFQLENTSHLDAAVYSVTGHRIATLGSGINNSGQNTLYWNGMDDNGRAVASGVYLLRLSSGNDLSHAKLFLMR